MPKSSLAVQRRKRNGEASGAASRHEQLHDAFKRFTEASSRLEEKYATLLAEAEFLREQVREKDLEIKRAERLSLLGETAAAIAHEVRNPLGSINLFLSLLEEDLGDRPESLAIVGQIKKSTANLDHVVSNILLFSRDRNCTVAPLNFASLIQEQIASFRSGEVAFEIVFSATGNPFLVGSEHGLRQVLYNLILNALQSMKYRGRVEIALGDRGDGVELRVCDSGPGIRGDLIDKIFDPFVTTKNEGTGLGLSIVKQIVVQHRGSVTARNTGDGAEFCVELPRGEVHQVRIPERVK